MGGHHAVGRAAIDKEPQVPDTPNAPAQAGAAGPAPTSTPSDAAAGGAASGGQSPDSNLSVLLSENRKLQERYDNLQKVLGKQSQELGQLRRRATVSDAADSYAGYVDNVGYETADASQRGGGDPVAQRLAATEQVLDLVRYRQEVPEWATFQPAVDKILNDEVRVYEVAAWKPDGFGGVVVDWYKTYRNAKNLVELEQLRNARSAAADAQSGQSEQRDTIRAMATMSGTTATPGQTGIDVASLRGKSAKEIAEIARQAGLLPPNDPPRY